MFLGIEDKKIIVHFQDEYVSLPEELQKKINSKWSEFINDNPTLWNGDTVCTYKINITQDTIELFCKKSNYAHHLYQDRVGLPKKYECRSLSAGVLMETKDGYFIISELEKNTSCPNMLNVPGGGIDKEEIEKDKIDYLKTIIRETKEEVNIDLNDKKNVEKYHLMGFYLADEGVKPSVQVFAKAKLNLSKDEMNKHFENYYNWLLENNGELEIKRLHFLHRNSCLEELDKLNNPKKSYLRPLLEFNI